MGTPVLKDILENWEQFQLDDDIYVPTATLLTLDTVATVLPFDRTRPRAVGELEYLLSFEQVRDVITGLEAQLHRSATPQERLRAVIHYARHDAFIDPAAAVAG
jgi:hypothetical protein